MPAKTLNWQPSILISVWVKCVLSNWIQALHSLQANSSAEKAVQLSHVGEEESLHLWKGALTFLCPSQSSVLYVIKLKAMFYFQKAFNYIF